MTINGTAGNDNLTGTSGNDTFNMTQGGDDTVSGLAGNDIFDYGSTFTAADSVNGGDGSDILRLDGNYASGLTFGASSLTSVEQIQLTGGFSYNLTSVDANVAAGATLAINASALGAGDSLTFNGVAEGDGHFNILGGAGNDTTSGGALGDNFTLSQGGNDVASGFGGNDVFNMGAALTAADRIDGGAGSDTVNLTGDYSGANAVTLSPTTIVNVETIKLGAGFNYSLTTDEATVASGATLKLDASALASGNTLTFNGSPESNGHFDIVGGAGNDTITGSSDSTGGDTFDLSLGGNDTASGHGTFLMGAALTAQDAITGTNNADTVVLNGDYTAGLIFGATTITDITTVSFAAGHSYSVTENNSNLASGGTLTFDGSQLGAGDSVTVNGAAETNGTLTFIDGAGTNIFTGGGHGDVFNALIDDAHSVLAGNGGNDTFAFSTFDSAVDEVNGGSGNDIVSLDNTGTIALNGTDFVSIERLDLFRSGDITTTDGAVGAGQTLTIDARQMVTGSLTIDGSAETDGHFDFYSPQQTSVSNLTGGALSDTFNLLTVASSTATGGGGADTFLIEGDEFGSTFTFVYNAVSDSTSTGYDTISRVNYAHAVFDVSGIAAVTGVDAHVDSGSLSTATFDSDLAADVGAGQLAAHHAVLFTANSGTLSGDTFLIIDENGTAGYQSGGDLVINVTGSTGTATLSESNFS
jgi:RTX calcium-binding nonapeptide repeat (4 copies)